MYSTKESNNSVAIRRETHTGPGGKAATVSRGGRMETAADFFLNTVSISFNKVYMFAVTKQRTQERVFIT